MVYLNIPYNPKILNRAPLSDCPTITTPFCDNNPRTMPENTETTPKKRTKLDLDALLTRIIELLVVHHPKTLTFSKVSQFTKVPRSTLYYYFGKNFSDLVKEAARFGLKALTDMYDLDAELQSEKPQFSSWEEFQEKRLHRVIELINQYRWAPGLYFRYRSDPHFFGEVVKEIEDSYTKKMGVVWKKYQGRETDLRSLRLSGYVKLGLFYGLAADPELWKIQDREKHLDPLIKNYTRMVTDILEKKYIEPPTSQK